MQIGSDFFKQKTGIPQGSKVSSLLCTLYYGHMERCRLSFLNKESSVGTLPRALLFLVNAVYATVSNAYDR